jgi:hypothetical protein
MNEDQHVLSLLTQLERSWEEERSRVPDAPPLEEVWELAMKQRGRHGLTKYVSMYEMLSLSYETAAVCFKADQKGGVKDFEKLFRVALLNRVRRHMGLTKRSARQRERLKEYAYDTRDRHVVVVDPLVAWVDDAVADLPPDDQWLIRMIYWHSFGIRKLARMTGIDDSKLSREHQRILGALKVRFVEDIWAMAEGSSLAA